MELATITAILDKNEVIALIQSLNIDIEFMGRLQQSGETLFTGTQHNPGYKWNADKLKEHSVIELWELYIQLKQISG